MQIQLGYELIYDCPQPTPMIVTLSIHFTRVSDIVIPDHLITSPSIPLTAYRDGFGNWCSRIVAPPGELRLSTNAVINDSGEPDPVVGSAYSIRCRISPRRRWCSCSAAATARPINCRRWPGACLSNAPTGWWRVQAICDFVHRHIQLWLRARPSHQNRMGGLQRARRRLPGFRPPGHRLLSLHEYSGALLHRLPQRHRSTATLRADGFRRLDGGLSGRPVAHLRPTQQCATPGPYSDCARPRCGRCRIHQHLRPQHAEELQSVDAEVKTIPQNS